MSTVAHSPSTSAHSQLGLSLVELMISLTIGLILLLGISMLIAQQNSTRDELDKSSRQIENGRYAMQILTDDISHAGYYGEYYNVPLPASAIPVITALPDPCDATLAGLSAAVPIHIQGYDYTPASPLSTDSFAIAPAVVSPIACIPANNLVKGSDILVVRRTDSTPYQISDAAAGVGGQIWMQTNTSTYVMNQGAGATSTQFPLTENTPANPASALRQYLVHIYFLSPCHVMANGTTCQPSDDNGRPVPTLKRLELSANGGLTTMNTVTPLVEGIQNLQLDYGLDNDGDGYPDSYTTTPATVGDWANVMSIRVSLLAQSIECTTGFTETKNFNLGMSGAVSAPASSCTNGDRKHHVFTELIRVINPSGRRAQQ